MYVYFFYLWYSLLVCKSCKSLIGKKMIKIILQKHGDPGKSKRRHLNNFGPRENDRYLIVNVSLPKNKFFH